MFGKVFSSLYTGSMIGAGPVPFALMPYVIANAVPDESVGGHVELNPTLLATIFGCSEKDVEEGIEFLCAPDPKSRSPDEGGRRLIRLGPYDYRVVNYAKYRAIKDEEQRREQNRVAQATFRAKKKPNGKRGKFVRSDEIGIADINSRTENGGGGFEPNDIPSENGLQVSEMERIEKELAEIEGRAIRTESGELAYQAGDVARREVLQKRKRAISG